MGFHRPSSLTQHVEGRPSIFGCFQSWMSLIDTSLVVKKIIGMFVPLSTQKIKPVFGVFLMGQKINLTLRKLSWCWIPKFFVVSCIYKTWKSFEATNFPPVMPGIISNLLIQIHWFNWWLLIMFVFTKECPFLFQNLSMCFFEKLQKHAETIYKVGPY